MQGSARRAAVGVSVGLALAVGLLYGRTAGFGFLSLDDPAYVAENPVVRAGLRPSGVAWAFTEVHALNWHPLTWLSLMVDVSLFGVDPGAMHRTNVVLHAAAAVLLFLALLRGTDALAPSALVAALFALHPLRVESVAWIAERKDVLSGFFWMLTLLAYLAFARGSTPLERATVFLAAALAMLSKPMAVTLPVVLLLLDRWPLRRPEPLMRLALEKLPLFALSLGVALATFRIQSQLGAVRSLEAIDLGARVANAAIAAVSYLGKSFWPVDLAIFYPHPAVLGRADTLLLPALCAATLLAGITAVAAATARSRPYLLVGWLWYLVTLLPVIGIVQVGDQALADRYTYLPTIGIAIALVWGARDVARSLRVPAALGAAVASSAVACLAALTWLQVPIFRDSRSVFAHALLVTDDNYYAHTALGRLERSEGRVEDAKRHLEEALRIRPELVLARVELGNVLVVEGDLEGAAALQEDVLADRPGSSAAHHALGLIRLRQDLPGQAALHFERSVALRPGFAEAHSNLGVAYRRLGRDEDAIRQFRRALQLRPGAAHPRANLREMGAEP